MVELQEMVIEGCAEDLLEQLDPDDEYSKSLLDTILTECSAMQRRLSALEALHDSLAELTCQPIFSLSEICCMLRATDAGFQPVIA